jgi:hypothetical protein
MSICMKCNAARLNVSLAPVKCTPYTVETWPRSIVGRSHPALARSFRVLGPRYYSPLQIPKNNLEPTGAALSYILSVPRLLR